MRNLLKGCKLVTNGFITATKSIIRAWVASSLTTNWFWVVWYPILEIENNSIWALWRISKRGGKVKDQLSVSWQKHKHKSLHAGKLFRDHNPEQNMSNVLTKILDHSFIYIWVWPASFWGSNATFIRNETIHPWLCYTASICLTYTEP